MLSTPSEVLPENLVKGHDILVPALDRHACRLVQDQQVFVLMQHSFLDLWGQLVDLGSQTTACMERGGLTHGLGSELLRDQVACAWAWHLQSGLCQGVPWPALRKGWPRRPQPAACCLASLPREHQLD